jgi:hypothetical protein
MKVLKKFSPGNKIFLFSFAPGVYAGEHPEAGNFQKIPVGWLILGDMLKWN